jgi:hypothetical protein
MKPIVALTLTLAALVLGAGVAHADNDSDYINNLKSHGLSPSPGTSESQWEAGAGPAGVTVRRDGCMGSDAG